MEKKFNTRKLLESLIVRRLISFYIDLIIVSIISLLYLFFIDVNGPFVQNKGFPFWDANRIWVFQLIVYFLYFLLLEYFLGYTFGKKILNLRISTNVSQNPKFFKVLFRTFIRILPINPISFLFNAEKRFWHEKWSNVYTVKKSKT
ncbi:RDD family protein [Allomuricauda sp. MMSF_3364]|uniref:RDD family protein n=1 Tax=unclassified Allomuricauda TaxID=2615049 RepID=UPI00391D7552